MGTGTKLITHEGMSSGMGIFLKHGYGDGHYGTLPNGYPLPSLPAQGVLKMMNHTISVTNHGSYQEVTANKK